MAFAISAKVDVRDAILRLAGLKQGRKSVILRAASTKSARLLAKTAKAKLSGRRKTQKKEGVQRTGQLAKSMGFNVKTYGSGVVVAIIGPRRGFKIQVGTRPRGGKKSKKGEVINHDPVHIAHLVEYGHGGPHPAPAHPFMRPALDSNAAAIQQIYRDEVTTGLAKLAAKGKL